MKFQTLRIEQLEARQMMAVYETTINAVKPLVNKHLMEYVAAEAGHERGGQISTHSPSDSSSLDDKLGFDFSSTIIATMPFTVRSGNDAGDPKGKMMALGNVRTKEEIEIDYDYTNQIFAAAGITIK